MRTPCLLAVTLSDPFGVLTTFTGSPLGSISSISMPICLRLPVEGLDEPGIGFLDVRRILWAVVLVIDDDVAMHAFAVRTSFRVDAGKVVGQHLRRFSRPFDGSGVVAVYIDPPHTLPCRLGCAGTV